MSGIKSSGLCGWEQQSTQTRRRSEEQRGNRVQGGVRYSGSRQEQRERKAGSEARYGESTGRQCVRQVRRDDGYRGCSQAVSARQERSRSQKQKRGQARGRRRQAAMRFFLCAAGLALCMWVLGLLRNVTRSMSGNSAAQIQGSAGDAGDIFRVGGLDDPDSGELPEILNELLEKNGETADYVQDYPNREIYKGQSVDLTEDFASGEVPLLMQWDKRWGYDTYGEEMIGLAGCGPLCLEMAYLYFTEDTDMTPRDMADFAYDNGYYTKPGTSWSLWTEGAARLGLKGAELSLDENVMKNMLDAGNLIVCSMRPGDFTTTGHFILIRGYNEDGFLVNDPNRRSNSGKTWSYEELQYQIRNLWSLGEG